MNLARLGLLVTCTALYVTSAIAQISPPNSSGAELATSDERISLVAGDHAPRLIHLAGHSGEVWDNESDETLPTSVTIDGASIPIAWSYKPELSTVDAHHVAFVYESTQPHLRLGWEWEARAAFGPIEHHITVENLTDKEIWLPLIEQPHPQLAPCSQHSTEPLLRRERRRYSFGPRHAS